MESHPLSRYFEVHGAKLPDPNPRFQWRKSAVFTRSNTPKSPPPQ